MMPPRFFSPLPLLGLLWLCVMLPRAWPSCGPVSSRQSGEPETPVKSRRKRFNAPPPFLGLPHKPPWARWDHEASPPTPPPPLRPEPLSPTTRRPRKVATTRHCCPPATCDYRGWLGLGHLRANGPPNGGPWRQGHCPACDAYLPDPHGTILPGKRVAVECIVRVLAWVAEGLGLRATARLGAVAPNTVLPWLVEAAEQLQALSAYCLCNGQSKQVPLDALEAVLREVKDGALSEREASERLERAPSWGWTAIAPERQRRLVLDVDPRTLAMAQRGGQHVIGRLAPDCGPLGVTDGLKDYGTAGLPQCGYWRQPERRPAKGPRPKPRGMPRPQCWDAQGGHSSRRRRLAGGQHRVVFGPLARGQQVLVAGGRKIHTAFVERLPLDLRQRVAAVGRRVKTLCQGAAGLQHQLAGFHADHNFVRPHASLRLALVALVPSKGTGSATRWRPCTPARAAGLSAHTWALQEGRLYRVPPGPQLQTVSSRMPVEDGSEERSRTLRYRPPGVDGGLQTSLAWGSPADCPHSGGMRVVSKQYPQPAGTRPRGPVAKCIWHRKNCANSGPNSHSSNMVGPNWPRQRQVQSWKTRSTPP